MSFSGKTFKRVSSENLDKLTASQNLQSNQAQQLLNSDALFCFTRVDDTTFQFSLQAGDRAINSSFQLGQEHEMERRDGTKVKVTYCLESDNVLSQTVRQPGGKVSHFRREFNGDDCVLTITVEDCDVSAKIYYKAV
ncbi:fatty acid-binding protein 2-like [Pectinophora gossypiella]|uniref:Lipocalin/cytosolic fatty-acid binding domain-containing protein n=1 Tax=Pectinophora gossypiella TaxID=13191 RepID=A0A1E1WTH6_PECGO|nr:fatty acid-binding protein 2-like [Pectinophora gossypiella]